MWNDLKFHFHALFKATSYFYVCIAMIIFGFVILLLSLDDINHINLIDYGPSVFTTFWMISSERAFFNLFLLAMPVIVSIPIMQYLSNENKAIQFIASRSSRLSFSLSKVIVSFFSGFSIVFFMMITHWLFTEIILHSSQDVFLSKSGYIISNSAIIEGNFRNPELLFTNPILVSFLYILKMSIWGGFLSLLVMSINTFLRNAMFAYILGFILIYMNMIFSELINDFLTFILNASTKIIVVPIIILHFSPFTAVKSLAPLSVVLIWAGLFCGFILYSFRQMYKKDVY